MHAVHGQLAGIKFLMRADAHNGFSSQFCLLALKVTQVLLERETIPRAVIVSYRGTPTSPREIHVHSGYMYVCLPTCPTKPFEFYFGFHPVGPYNSTRSKRCIHGTVIPPTLPNPNPLNSTHALLSPPSHRAVSIYVNSNPAPSANTHTSHSQTSPVPLP